MNNHPTRADIDRLQNSLIETRDVQRQQYRFPPLKSQAEIDDEAGLSGLTYSLFVIFCGSVSVCAFGIGYALQSWWMAW